MNSNKPQSIIQDVISVTTEVPPVVVDLSSKTMDELANFLQDANFHSGKKHCIRVHSEASAESDLEKTHGHNKGIEYFSIENYDSPLIKDLSEETRANIILTLAREDQRFRRIIEKQITISDMKLRFFLAIGTLTTFSGVVLFSFWLMLAKPSEDLNRIKDFAGWLASGALSLVSTVVVQQFTQKTHKQ